MPTPLLSPVPPVAAIGGAATDGSGGEGKAAAVPALFTVFWLEGRILREGEVEIARGGIAVALDSLL
jgi:hypothetical protein